MLPTSYTLSSQRLDVNSQPAASGDSADVYEGTLDGSKVCIKRVRIYSQKDSQTGPTKVSRPIASSEWRQ